MSTDREISADGTEKNQSARKQTLSRYHKNREGSEQCIPNFERPHLPSQNTKPIKTKGGRKHVCYLSTK